MKGWLFALALLVVVFAAVPAAAQHVNSQSGYVPPPVVVYGPVRPYPYWQRPIYVPTYAYPIVPKETWVKQRYGIWPFRRTTVYSRLR